MGVVDEISGILRAPAVVAECTPYTPYVRCGEMHPVHSLHPDEQVGTGDVCFLSPVPVIWHVGDV